MIAPALGVPSEVWLYRQASMIDQLEVEVLCYRHHNRADYPARGFRVVELYPADGLMSRAWRRLKRATRKRFMSAEDFIQNDIDAATWQRVMANRFDTCLLHYGTMAIKFARRLTEAKVPYAIHFNGFDLSEKVLDPDYVRQIQPALQSAKALVVVAHYMRDWLIQQKIDPARIHYLPYGVPLEQYQAGHRNGSGCRFLMVGRLTAKKAPLATLRAFARCHDQSPEARLRIIGDGPLREACQQLIEELNLAEAVEFLGSQPAEVVRQEMAAANVFVQHSLTPASGDREGWPVAIAEAAASGLPIVSTRHASIPEQVVDTETGFLVEEQDWQAMAERMAQLAREPATRQAMGARAREHIANWSTVDQVRKLEQVLLSTLPDHPAPRADHDPTSQGNAT